MMAPPPAGTSTPGNIGRSRVVQSQGRMCPAAEQHTAPRAASGLRGKPGPVPLLRAAGCSICGRPTLWSGPNQRWKSSTAIALTLAEDGARFRTNARRAWPPSNCSAPASASSPIRSSGLSPRSKRSDRAMRAQAVAAVGLASPCRRCTRVPDPSRKDHRVPPLTLRDGCGMRTPYVFGSRGQRRRIHDGQGHHRDDERRDIDNL